MKLITVIIKPFRLDQLREALSSGGVHGMTVSEVRGVGRNDHAGANHLHPEANFSFAPKLKIEAVVEDDHAMRLIDLIARADHDAGIGGGKIFVSHIENAVRIRTGEVDETAL